MDWWQTTCQVTTSLIKRLSSSSLESSSSEDSSVSSFFSNAPSNTYHDSKFKIQLSHTWNIQTTQFEDLQDPFVSRCVRAPQPTWNEWKQNQCSKTIQKKLTSIFSAKALGNTRKGIHKLHGSFGMYLCPNTLLAKCWYHGSCYTKAPRANINNNLQACCCKDQVF